MEIEWKKIASMEYGKIVFHYISYHALLVTALHFIIKHILSSDLCFHIRIGTIRACERGVQGVHRTRARALGGPAPGARKSSRFHVNFW